MTEIRRADLRADRGVLIENLRCHLNPRADESRYEWLYEAHPHGQPMVWLALDGPSGDVIGSAAVLPRLLVDGDATATVYQMCDFWVHPRHRVLGPAVKLQRACIDGVAALGAPFYVDLPAAGMLAVYRRLKVEPRAALADFVLPLRVDAYLEKRELPIWLRRGLVPVGNTLLGLRRARGRRPMHDVVIEDGDFDEEVEQLTMATHAPTLARTSDYLNWRYRRHYRTRYQVVTGRRGGELAGFAVFCIDSREAKVVVVCGRDGAAVLDLVRTVAAIADRQDLVGVRVPLLPGAAIAPALARIGFRRRGDRPVICQTLSRDCGIAVDGRWPFDYGDVDFDVG